MSQNPAAQTVSAAINALPKVAVLRTAPSSVTVQSSLVERLSAASRAA